MQLSFATLFTTAALFLSSAFAQSIQIGAPADQSTVSPGQNITIEVDKPVSLPLIAHICVVVRG